MLKVWIRLHNAINRDRVLSSSTKRRTLTRKFTIDPNQMILQIHKQLLQKIDLMFEGRKVSQEMFLEEYWNIKNNIELQHRNYLEVFEIKNQLIRELQQLQTRGLSHQQMKERVPSTRARCQISQKMMLHLVKGMCRVAGSLLMYMKNVKSTEPIRREAEVTRIRNVQKRVMRISQNSTLKPLSVLSLADLMREAGEVKKTILLIFNFLAGEKNPEETKLRRAATLYVRSSRKMQDSAIWGKRNTCGQEKKELTEDKSRKIRMNFQSVVQKLRRNLSLLDHKGI